MPARHARYEPVKSKKTWFSPAVLCPCLCLYFELVFHLLIYRSAEGLLFPLLFSVPTGMLAAFVLGLFPRRAGQVLLPVITFIATVIYSAQVIYYSVFRTFFSVYSMGNGGQITQFMSAIFLAIAKNWLPILLFLVPVVLVIVLRSRIRYRIVTYWQPVLCGAAGALLYGLLVLVLPLGGTGYGTAHEVYHNYTSAEQAVEHLGLAVNMRLDIRTLLFGTDDGDLDIDVPSATPTAKPTPTPSATATPETQPTATAEPTPEPLDTSPNVLNIDFAAAAENAPNDAIRTLCEYFSTVTPTNRNEYTGMFEGYNMIFLTAESFSPLCVDKDLTPTLYKMVNSGFVFNNFYNGLWGVSTSDGEYVNLTGLIPKQNVWSMKVSGEQSNDMWHVYGKMFRENGYSTYAFHNNYYDYYDRDISHPNLGYDYYGLGNGLDVEECWPESDLEMMQKSLPFYIEDDLFHVYYMTVSGHMVYDYTGNMMAYRHSDDVAHLDHLSEEARAYLACNLELDLALEYLIDELDKAGKLDKTVFVLQADHYPYGLTNGQYSELLGHEVDETFELYKNNLIIWNSAMEEPVMVDKYGYAIDINPTVMNLFGMPYDSRLLMGHDLLSDAPQFMFLLSRSFVTDVCMYNSDTDEVTPMNGQTVPDGYVSSVLEEIATKYKVSAAMLEQDFFGYIRDYIRTE